MNSLSIPRDLNFPWQVLQHHFSLPNNVHFLQVFPGLKYPFRNLEECRKVNPTVKLINKSLKVVRLQTISSKMCFLPKVLQFSISWTCHLFLKVNQNVFHCVLAAPVCKHWKIFWLHLWYVTGVESASCTWALLRIQEIIHWNPQLQLQGANFTW